MRDRRSRGRRLRAASALWTQVALLLVVMLVASGPAAARPAAPGASAGDPLTKVDQKVLDQLATKDGATFFVILHGKADLSGANAIRKHGDRAAFVYDRLTSFARQSQAGLTQLLATSHVSWTPYWIANTIKVTADQALLRQIAARPEVDRIVPENHYAIPAPKKGSKQATVNSIEWNIDRIRAPDVWSTFGDRGEGIVVANVDTGVQFDHPAVVRQYRGNLGNGQFDHNYNWFDPSQVCGSPSLVPCDNVGHGTHTMGTMVGDDGDPGTNQIGVAPHARWIAAKGCESNFCSDTALLASGQWIVAPTDLSGQNPRPDLAPNIVNNSWGDGPGNNFYQAIVDAWNAAGIFPAFSNGNAGPGCGSAGSPGDYLNSYSAGAFDINNQIAFFSSRGPSAFGGELKPNVAAPGVNVRSSVPGGYDVFSGTSMASPHVSGTVALIWSAAPALLSDIAATRQLLDQTAVDTSDLSCGGTPADNNVWGEGRLDAFAAVQAAPRGPTGILTGTVTDTGGQPIQGTRIHAAGPEDRDTTTDSSGHYSLTLPVGTYDVTASHFGYLSQTASGVQVNEGQTTVQDFALALAPSHAVSGHVRDNAGSPIAGATVTILGTPIAPATTDASGAYSFASVPEGSYDIKADPGGGCFGVQTQHVDVTGDLALDFTLPRQQDHYGYVCENAAFDWVDAGNVLPLSGDDATTQVTLPFPFTLYGQTYTTANVATNGFVDFAAPNASFINGSIPSADAPNAAVYGLWDDLFVDGSASVRTQVVGSAPNRKFVIEWSNVAFLGQSLRVSFEIVLTEHGQHVVMQYNGIGDTGRQKGDSATIGIENAAGDDALQFSFNQPTLRDQLAVEYRVPNSAFIQGTVTDRNDGQPVSGARVSAARGGSTVREATTNASGFYRLQLPLDSYAVQATAQNYSTESAQVTLGQEDATVSQDFALRTPRAGANPASLQIIAPPNQSRTRTLTLSNSGSANLTWETRESGGGKVATGSTTAGLSKVKGFDPNARTTQGLYAGGTPAGWAPQTPGDVLKHWTPTGLSLAWGVGFTSNVWLSDVPSNNNNHEFTVDGAPTGRMWHASWAGAWPGDMAYDAGRGLMCQVNVGGDNGIYCWDPNTGSVVDSITGSFPWTSISQRGLAYRADDDSFYIGGWNQGVVYHVKGLSHPDKGAIIGQCNPPDGNISGLAWNPAFNILWEATNSPTDTIYELNPDTCSVITTLPHPTPGFNGAGLEMDDAGNLWTIGQNPNTAYLIDSGVPAFNDVPWLSESPTSGTVAPGGSQAIRVTVDTHGLQPGVYDASIFIQSNAARQSTLRVPVRLIVPGYQVGANAGGGTFVDSLADAWSPDQAYSSGSWGYLGNSKTSTTKQGIAGTDDDPLYQDLRDGMFEYRFDGLAPGVYQMELRFAELKQTKPNTHLFDVIAEDQLVLPALDIAREVGSFTADDHSFLVRVTDGQLNIRFVARKGFGTPTVNAIRVTARPDQH
jgi:subtilisin family serine protease